MALTTENLQEALRDYQRAGSYAWSVGGLPEVVDFKWVDGEMVLVLQSSTGVHMKAVINADTLDRLAKELG